MRANKKDHAAAGQIGRGLFVLPYRVTFLQGSSVLGMVPAFLLPFLNDIVFMRMCTQGKVTFPRPERRLLRVQRAGRGKSSLRD